MRYELELNTDIKSLDRIKDLFTSLYDILMIQYNDSFDGLTGEASPHYVIKIDVKDEWV